jgi:putative NADPH-quinone reductase
MANIIIISGHPRAGSFTEQLGEAYLEGAKSAGHYVEIFKLHQIDLGPALLPAKPAEEHWSQEIEDLWHAMTNADHIVVAHPLWWGSMPGELKMLFDRLLVSGKAYSYAPKKPFPIGHLAGRTAEVIMTSDTPNWYYKLGYFGAQSQLMKNQILKFVGLKPTRFTHISPIRTMDDQERRDHLAKVKKLGANAKLKPQQKSAA